MRPQLQLLLDQLTEIPAMILGRNMDILAWNSLAAALITDFSQIPESQRNHVRLVFTDPAIRHLYADWEGVARMNVAMLRMDAAENPDDPRLAALVGELSLQDPQFRQWWAAQQVASRSFGRKILHHPVVGALILDWDTFICATDPEQQLIIMTAVPGSASHDALRILASWSATPASQR